MLRLKEEPLMSATQILVFEWKSDKKICPQKEKEGLSVLIVFNGLEFTNALALPTAITAPFAFGQNM